MPFDGVDLEIESGKITGLIGPNGAGKTTLFNIIAGHFGPTRGQVFLDGNDITGLKPHELFARGLLRTFQIAHEFSSLSVRENLMMVPDHQPGESLLQVWTNPRSVRAREEEVRAKAQEVIEFLEITHVADELAGNLSGGTKKIARAGPHHDGGCQNCVFGMKWVRGSTARFLARLAMQFCG